MSQGHTNAIAEGVQILRIGGCTFIFTSPRQKQRALLQALNENNFLTLILFGFNFLYTWSFASLEVKDDLDYCPLLIKVFFLLNKSFCNNKIYFQHQFLLLCIAISA